MDYKITVSNEVYDEMKKELREMRENWDDFANALAWHRPLCAFVSRSRFLLEMENNGELKPESLISLLKIALNDTEKACQQSVTEWK